MPCYSIDQERFPGSKFPPIYPCDVLDADGNVVGVRVVCFDDTTGRVVSKYPLYDPAGNFLDQWVEVSSLHKPPLAMRAFVPVARSLEWESEFPRVVLYPVQEDYLCDRIG